MLKLLREIWIFFCFKFFSILVVKFKLLINKFLVIFNLRFWGVRFVLDRILFIVFSSCWFCNC